MMNGPMGSGGGPGGPYGPPGPGMGPPNMNNVSKLIHFIIVVFSNTCNFFIPNVGFLL